MSHDATNWAIKQRGIKPAAKIVLWHLCDRYHEDHGCFPSLDTLAEDCEMSRRSVQDQLDALEKIGLIRVEKMPRKAGQLPRNRYRLAFEAGFSLGQDLPLANSALGKNGPSPLANSRKNLGQNLPTNPVKGTSKRTSNSARDADEVRTILCEILPEQTADAFIEHRRHKRAKLTPNAASLIVRKLADHPNPVAEIERSIMQGWTGVFPEAHRVSQPRHVTPDLGKFFDNIGAPQ